MERHNQMKAITVYGPGCAKCTQTEELVRRVVAETGVAADVVKVSDIREMVTAGIMSTPAVAVDGVVRSTGRVPKAEDVKRWILE
jgi:small redox-active disulfide protein 2